ncbi:MAG: HEPN domain-containing protein [Dehalococcoidia bacterium]
MRDLPELSLVAFRIDNPGEHPGGGHCVSLSRTEVEGTRELVEQYLAALRHLADRAAEEVDGGWALTRPLLFHAHHTAELAVKTALLEGGVAFEARHGLEDLWATIEAVGLDQSVSAVDTAWCRDFLALVAAAAGNSIGARYARPNRGHLPVDDVWCCVSPIALFTATECFAVQCIAMSQAAAELPTA